MCVLYAFMRKTDDLGDQEELPLAVRTEQLQQWHSDLQAVLAGQVVSDPILVAMGDVAQHQEIPSTSLLEVIRGVQGDLTPRTFQTFPELEHYCYQVAGVVGLCCLKIWGYRGTEPLPAAIACGTAFQLTNVLRDLKEDAQRGRIYLPQEELQNYGYSAEELQQGVLNSCFRDLMQFQVDRAWSYYRDAFPLQEELSVPGRRIFLAFFDLYTSLLREIEKAEFDVFSRRIGLSRWKKVRVVMSCLLKLEPRFPVLMSAGSAASSPLIAKAGTSSSGGR